jgi:hypothetical protein
MMDEPMMCARNPGTARFPAKAPLGPESIPDRADSRSVSAVVLKTASQRRGASPAPPKTYDRPYSPFPAASAPKTNKTGSLGKAGGMRSQK